MTTLTFAKLKRLHRLILWSLPFVLLFIGSGVTALSSALADKSIEVLRVIDGDTLLVQLNDHAEKVRLIGIDAPESRAGEHAKRQASAKGVSEDEILRQGKSATKFMRSIVADHPRLSIEFDRKLRDRYGRLLAYLYLPNGEMVNEIMIHAGHADAVAYEPNLRYVERLKQAKVKE